ncbi:MAG: histidine kinase, partial [Spirochaetes bacterium]|nr:histidine kinase [Spirochaetota bacterium]
CFKSSINNKFILITTITMALFLIALMFAVYYLNINYSLNNAKELSTTVLNGTNRNITAFLNELEVLAQTLSRQKAVYQINQDLIEDIFMTNVLRRKSYLNSIFFGASDGRLLRWSINDGFTDYTYDPLDVASFINKPWYQTGLKEKQYKMIGPYLVSDYNILGITCSIPVYDERNRFIGVLGFDILLDDLETQLMAFKIPVMALKIPKNGRALLLTQSGRIIISQWKTNKKISKYLSTYHSDVVEAISKTTNGSLAFKTSEEKLYFSYKKNEITDWYVAIVFPYDELLKDPRNVFKAILVISLFLIFILAFIMIILTRNIVLLPILNINKVIEESEDGQKGVRVEIRSSDEIGTLGKNFNKLLNTVENYSRSMEEKVKTRAKKIEVLTEENIKLRIVKEREDIYRNLHDSIGARLTNINISNQVAKTMLTNENENFKNMIINIENNCQKAIQDLKNIVLQQEDEELRLNEFMYYVEEIVKSRLALKKIHFILKKDNLEWISLFHKKQRANIQNIIREMVSNVLKHSNCTKVLLEIKLKEDKILIHFKDNGKGFDFNYTYDSSFGLKNLIKRITDMRGDYQIKTRPGLGTSYRIYLPVK